MSKPSRLEKLCAKEKPTKNELLEILSTQFQIVYAFRTAGKEPNDAIHHMNHLLKYDSLFAGHVVAMEEMLKVKQRTK